MFDPKSRLLRGYPTPRSVRWIAAVVGLAFVAEFLVQPPDADAALKAAAAAAAEAVADQPRRSPWNGRTKPRP